MSRLFTPDEETEIRQAAEVFASSFRLRVIVSFNDLGAWFTISDAGRSCSSGLYPAEFDRLPAFVTLHFMTVIRLEKMWWPDGPPPRTAT